MDSFISLPPFDLAFADLYSGSSGLIEKTYQFDASIQTSTYQGMTVQTLDTSFPGYHNQSDIVKNKPAPLNLLNKYDIEPLTLSGITPETAGFFETDTTDMPTSVIDEYILSNSDNEPINNVSSSIPDIHLIQQICLSGREPEIRGPIPESHSNPDCPLTNRPDVLSNPQDLRPLTAINPLNLNQAASEKQTTRAKDIVNDNSSIIERKKSYRRERYKNDPDFAERLKARSRERQRELRKDPAYVERERKRQRELRKDPAFIERERKHKRELHKDPAFLKRKRAYNRERYQNDPDFAEHQKARFRARYQNDHDFAERHRERNRLRSRLRKKERHMKSNKQHNRKPGKYAADQNSYAVHV